MQNNNLTKEIAKMRSLMERMEKPHTERQAMLNEQMHLTEGVTRRVESPEKVFDIINQIGKNQYVCVGAVEGANLNIPQVKRKNPETNRMKNYDDWETFGNEVGYEGEIGALVKITSYNFRYYNLNDFNKQYSDWKGKANDVRANYDLPPIADRESDYREKMNYGNGVNVYGGQNQDLSGEFYLPYNGSGVNRKSVVYVVDTNGNITQELPEDKIVPYLKAKREMDGVSALRKMGADEDKIEQFIKDMSELKFSYRQFKGNSILWIAATVNDQKIVYINDQLKQTVSGIDVNPTDFVEKAKERYEVEMNNMPE